MDIRLVRCHNMRAVAGLAGYEVECELGSSSDNHAVLGRAIGASNQGYTDRECGFCGDMPIEIGYGKAFDLLRKHRSDKDPERWEGEHSFPVPETQVPV